MNDYNEKVIKNVLDMKRAEEDAEFLKEIQEAKNNPAFKKKKNETKLFIKEVSKSKNHRPMLRAASIVLVVVASLAIVTVSVEGFGEKITSFFSNFVSSDYAAVDVDEEDNLFSEYKGMYVPTFIPEGYKVESVVNGEDIFELILKNNKKCMVIIREQSLDLKSNIDTEDADAVKEIEINGMNGLYVKKGQTERVVLVSDATMLYITDNDSNVDLIGFAELIEKR
ncbi:MAG: DUF4367 domain-containing protein [Clostridia bacterium]|nr:DUF4367 domain-containing protein [Clostridia bacterium]